MSKTFGQAFSEARKQGLDKFLWNGNWYTTKTKEETGAHVTTVTLQARNTKDKTVQGKAEVVDGEAQISVSLGNRYAIVPVKDQYAIIDKETGAFIGNAFNTLEEASKFANSDSFKNSGEIVVSAPRVKVDRETPGYLPVDSRTDLTDREGNTRTFQNYETGEVFVTDNYGNIVGQSYDPAATQNGWYGFNTYTGSQLDAVRSELGEKKAEYDRNEVNQLAQLKEDRQRAGEEGLIRDIQDARHNFAAGTVNFASNAFNLPNHTVMGLLRLPSDNYSWLDYVNGFNVANFTGDVGQTVGLGDVFEVDNPYLRTGLNFANLYSMPRGFTPASYELNAGQPYYRGTLRYPTQLGSVYRYTKNTFPAKGWGNEASAAQASEQLFNIGTPTMTYTSGSFTPGNIYNTGFMGIRTPEAPELQYVPTEVFTYQNGPTNQTVMGRILTGDFVPGTTSPDWDGTIHGGQSEMYNTSGQHFPGYGGVTAGPANDNTTDVYANDSAPADGGKPRKRLLKRKKK